MKRILLVAAAVVGLNSFARTAQVTVRANVQEAAFGNAAGEVSYDGFFGNKVSVGAFGNYNVGTEVGANVSKNYSETAAHYGLSSVDAMKEGYSAGVSANYFHKTNSVDSAFAGVKVSYEKGKYANTKGETVKTTDAKGEEVSTRSVNTTDSEGSFVTATVPVGYQWAFNNGVNVSSSVEGGARYDLSEKFGKDAFRPYGRVNVLSVGMQF